MITADIEHAIQNMATPLRTSATAAATLVPTETHGLLRDQLAHGEAVLFSLETDLDENLHYGKELLVLTDSRLLSHSTSRDAKNGAGVWRSWMVQADRTLRTTVQGAIGSLELVGRDGLIANWCYTSGLAPMARALVQQWEMHHQGMPAPSATICPSCGGPMPNTDDRCAACNPVQERQSLSALFRLVGFAKPRAAMIALGFSLTLAGTAASLVPPYLTMPLLDELFPHAVGRNVDFNLVYLYLAGLFGAAVLAWLLDWVRSYVSAWVSERISSDLRQHTYAHLQNLSIEFFGCKRTGDLMSRISSDTDRICNFLSSYLVDFITDVLMIGMTAAVLLKVQPWLALATLVPFPIIVWLVNWSRSRLLRGYRRGSIAWADMTSVLADTIPGIRVVKAFAQEGREIQRFRASNERVLSANDRVNVTWSFFGPIITFLTTMGLLVVWAFAAWHVYHSNITVGVLTLFIAYITRFYARSESMIRIYSHTQRAAAGAERIFEILDRSPSVPDPEKPIHPGRLRGGIELRRRAIQIRRPRSPARP